ncbi:MAG: hypothetical protein ACKV19_27705, partial [Verrucomicrobiales bacterium]
MAAIRDVADDFRAFLSPRECRQIPGIHIRRAQHTRAHALPQQWNRLMKCQQGHGQLRVREIRPTDGQRRFVAHHGVLRMGVVIFAAALDRQFLEVVGRHQSKPPGLDQQRREMWSGAEAASEGVGGHGGRLRFSAARGNECFAAHKNAGQKDGKSARTHSFFARRRSRRRSRRHQRLSHRRPSPRYGRLPCCPAPVAYLAASITVVAEID